MNTRTHMLMDSPIGILTLVADGQGLCSIDFPPPESPPPGRAWQEGDGGVLPDARRQLEEYFAGTRREFDLPLSPGGTDFQRTVWRELAAIPYGSTWSYRDIANRIGRPTATRAVGAANGRNPLPIVVPCHRVIGADGSLTGFSGGLPIKLFLLRLEGSLPGDTGSLFQD